MLAYVHWSMIWIKDEGTYFYHTIAKEYRQVQHVAANLGGTISLNNSMDYGTNATFTISSSLLAA